MCDMKTHKRYEICGVWKRRECLDVCRMWNIRGWWGWKSPSASTQREEDEDPDRGGRRRGGGRERLVKGERERRTEGLDGRWQVIPKEEVVSGIELIKMWFVLQADYGLLHTKEEKKRKRKGTDLLWNRKSNVGFLFFTRFCFQSRSLAHPAGQHNPLWLLAYSGGRWQLFLYHQQIRGHFITLYSRSRKEINLNPISCSDFLSEFIILPHDGGVILLKPSLRCCVRSLRFLDICFFRAPWVLHSNADSSYTHIMAPPPPCSAVVMRFFCSVWFPPRTFHCSSKTKLLR